MARRDKQNPKLEGELGEHGEGGVAAEAQLKQTKPLIAFE